MTDNKNIAMKVSDVAVFNKVAASLSFTRAGQIIGLSRSAVSKRIARLEEDLGVLLLNRSARKISLTAAGERFYDHSIKLESTLRSAGDAVKDAKETPYGKLAFTLPTSLGASFIPLLMREFQIAWPDIDLQVDLDDRYVDVVGEGFDVAIRVARKLNDSAMMSKRLLSSPEVLAASPGFIEKYGRPFQIEEIANSRCLAMVNRDAVWRLRGPDRPVNINLKNVTTFNNELAMILAAVLDSGILLVPRILVESEIQLGRLEVVLPKYSSRSEVGVFAVYPNRYPTANARIFVEFIEEWLPRLGELDRWDPLQLSNR